MLEKKYRLKKNKEFNYVFKKGENFFSKYLAVFYTKTKISPIKIGFSISAKIGNSVKRHKLKRQLTNILKNYLLTLNQSYNYVFMARQGIEDLNFAELKDNVEYILKKANLLI